MSSFTKLPQSLEELKRLPFADRQRLWAKYSPHPFRRWLVPARLLRKLLPLVLISAHHFHH